MKMNSSIIRFCFAAYLGFGAMFQTSGLGLENSVLSGGGGSSRAGRFQLDGSIGQPFAETEGAGAEQGGLRSGFWSQVVRWLNVVPVAHEDVIEHSPNLGAQVLIRTLLENDTGADRELLQFISVDLLSDAGGTVFRDGPWIFYRPPPDAIAGAEDAFVYSVRDALGAVVTGIVRIRIAESSTGGPRQAMLIERLNGPEGLVKVRFHGVALRLYEVQMAAEPIGPWVTAALLTAVADGTVMFTETPASGSRFFRVIEALNP